MKHTIGTLYGTISLAVLPTTSALACPLCSTGTGKQVRAGLFDGRFGYNMAVTLVPFPIFVGIAALLYYGPPKRKVRTYSKLNEDSRPQP